MVTGQGTFRVGRVLVVDLVQWTAQSPVLESNTWSVHWLRQEPVSVLYSNTHGNDFSCCCNYRTISLYFLLEEEGIKNLAQWLTPGIKQKPTPYLP